LDTFAVMFFKFIISRLQIHVHTVSAFDDHVTTDRYDEC